MNISTKTNEILSTLKQGTEVRDPTPIALYSCYLRNTFLSGFNIEGKGRIFISTNDDRSYTGKITIDGSVVLPEYNYHNDRMPLCFEFSKSVSGKPYDDSYAAYIGIILY